MCLHVVFITQSQCKFISTVAENFKWTPIKKKVHSKIDKKTVDMTFHRLNVIHMYNFVMVSVKVADQICMQYRQDRWMSNRKWWWSIFLWTLAGAARNAYLIYRGGISQDKRNKMYQVPNEMSHLQFLIYLSTHLMTSKKRKSQHLRNTSAFSVACVNKR